ncbi:MAG: hypothetical protein ACOX4L_02005 [Bacillota bacterium]
MQNKSPFDDAHENKKIKKFISMLEERGFYVQQGELRHVEFLKLCSEDIVDSCLGNNVDALYGGCALPPAPPEPRPMSRARSAHRL